MKIGIYGSSFDPITNVHLWTANTVAKRKKLDRVIFLPSSSKRTDKECHVEDHHRLRMVEMAIEDNPRFECNPYEMNGGVGKHFTYHTMRYFKEILPEDDIFFILGADLLLQISHWHHGPALVAENQFIVMARNGIDMLKAIAKDPILRNHDDGRFHLLDKGLIMDISSTYIREEFSLGGDPRYLLPEKCYQYIVEHQLYQDIS